MTRDVRRAVVLAALLLLSGCTAPAHDLTPGDAESGISVNGAGLPVDADAVFDRVARLMGADPPRPESIRVRTPSDLEGENGSSGSGLDPAPAFFEIMDVDSDPGEGLDGSEALALENGRTNLGLGTVTLFTGENDSETIHYILAHEFVHYVQGARDRGTQLRTRLGSTTDGTFVLAGLLEGAAVYATNAYIDEHVGGNLTNSALYFDLRERLAPGSFADYANSRYIVGWRYVSGRAASPNATDGLYENPPRTGEQLIHGLAPGEEPPRPLTVNASTGNYRRVGTDRLGEGFVRIALRNGPSRERANEAAAGWGNDTLRTYLPEGGGDPGYAWVLRFDDPANRSQFVATLRDSLSTRGNRTGDAWTVPGTATFDLRPVGDETVAVLAGNGSFVRNTTVSGSDANVSLSLPG
jgi:hypothetical protein